MNKMFKFRTHIASPEMWSIMVCVSAIIILLCLFGYASGYGSIVDNSVVFNRISLFKTMLRDYTLDEGEWSFGYFVPIAVSLLFWFRRADLLNTKIRPSVFVGGGICLISLLIYWAGYRGEQKYFGYAAVQLLILGAILWFLGWAWFRKIFWLWLLLGMMWPWRFLVERISSPLQLIMVKLTSGFMHLIGVKAFAHGSELRTGTLDPLSGIPISLDVGVECSGMRSLFALIMIGLVFAFLKVKEEWKRWIVMLCVPIVAIIGNFVRMLLLYFGAAAFGTDFAIGKGHENISAYHIGAGLAVFVVALLILSGLTHLLENGWSGLKRNKVSRRHVGVSDVN